MKGLVFPSPFKNVCIFLKRASSGHDIIVHITINNLGQALAVELFDVMKMSF